MGSEMCIRDSPKAVKPVMEASKASHTVPLCLLPLLASPPWGSPLGCLLFVLVGWGSCCCCAPSCNISDTAGQAGLHSLLLPPGVAGNSPLVLRACSLLVSSFVVFSEAVADSCLPPLSLLLSIASLLHLSSLSHVSSCLSSLL